MTFMEFESMDQMIEFMQKRTDEANRDLAPAQQAVTYGDCWARFDTIATTGVPEFGYVLTLDEAATNQEERASVEAEHERGYLFSRAYSAHFPDGELGDTHRANLWPIDRAVFDALAAVEWDHNAVAPEHKVHLEIAYQAARAHAKGLTS